MTGRESVELSALGAELHRAATVLTDIDLSLADAAHDPSVVRAELSLVSSLTDQLRRMAAVLQEWSTDDVHDSQQLARVSHEAERVGLVVGPDGLEPVPGPSRVDPADRARALTRLSRDLARAHSVRDRHRRIALAETQRSLAALEELSYRARGPRPLP